MIDKSRTRLAAGQKLWHAIRFVLFGIGGFVAIWISWLAIIFAFGSPSDRWFSPFVAVPLNILGALMMLYGGGQWGRWAYLWVFVSVPLVITPLGWLAQAHPAADWFFAKPIAIILFVLPMPLSYLLVKKYYRRREIKLKRSA